MQASMSDFEAKIVALNASPSVVSLRSTTGRNNQFFCSGIIVESKPEAGRFANFILTSASLFRDPSGNPTLPSEVKIKVRLPHGRRIKGEVFPSSIDFHYNLAVIKVMSNAHLSAATFRTLDDSIPRMGEASRDLRALHLRRYQVCPFKLPIGDQVVAVARTYQNSNMMFQSGQFSVRLCELDCPELCMTSCKTDTYFIGGPLLNCNGEVIGINFYHMSRSPFLPSNIALKCLERLKLHENVLHPWHGIVPCNLHSADVHIMEQIIQNFPNINMRESVLVDEVKTDTPADRAKILEGDVIFHCNGIPVSCSTKFYEMMWENTGKSVEMLVGRGHCKSFKVDVVVEETAQEKFNRWPIHD